MKHNIPKFRLLWEYAGENESFYRMLADTLARGIPARIGAMRGANEVANNKIIALVSRELEDIARLLEVDPVLGILRSLALTDELGKSTTEISWLIIDLERGMNGTLKELRTIAGFYGFSDGL